MSDPPLTRTPSSTRLTRAPSSVHTAAADGPRSPSYGGSGPQSPHMPAIMLPPRAMHTSQMQSPSANMSHTDVRGGLDMLRAQVAVLQNENDQLKATLSQVERERTQEVRRMRSLLGRGLVRQHTQSHKLRRLLVHLHTQVLDVAELLNAEQAVSDRADNLHVSVQGEEDMEDHASNLMVAGGGDSAVAQQARNTFLLSLARLRPARVARALQENLERLFSSMSDVLARCPKYRSELDFSFRRNIELKESLLASEAAHARTQERVNELQSQANSLAAQTDFYRTRNDELVRDMRLTLDLERRRRLRDNTEQIKVRTSLYKQVLADRSSPLHPANLARIGKPGKNHLTTLAGELAAREQAANAPEQERLAAEQRAYYLERKLAQEQEALAEEARRIEADEQAQKQQQADEEAQALSAEQSPPSSSSSAAAAEKRELTPAELAELAAERARAELKFMFPDGDLSFTKKRVDPLDPLGRSEDLAGYRFREGELERYQAAMEELQRQREAEEEAEAEAQAAAAREAEESKQDGSASGPHLPPLTRPSKAGVGASYYPEFKAKLNGKYSTNHRVFAAYSHSNEWMRQQAQVAAAQKAAFVAATNPTVAATTSPRPEPQADTATTTTTTTTTAGGSSNRAAHHSSPTPAKSSKRESGGGGSSSGHVGSPSSPPQPLHFSAFPSAQRIYPHKVGVGGNPDRRDTTSPPPNSLLHAPEWRDNFGAPAVLAAQDRQLLHQHHQQQHSPATQTRSLNASASAPTLPRLTSPGQAPRTSVSPKSKARHLASSSSSSSSPAGSGETAAAAASLTAAASSSAAAAAPAPSSSPSPSPFDWSGTGTTDPYSDDVLITTTHTSSMFRFASQQPYGSGVGTGGVGGTGGPAGMGGPAGVQLSPFKAAPRGSSMSRRAPQLGSSGGGPSGSGSKKHAASSASSASNLYDPPPQYLRTIPPSPRREGGLF